MAKGMNPFAKMAKGKGKMDPKAMEKQKMMEKKKTKKKY